MLVMKELVIGLGRGDWDEISTTRPRSWCVARTAHEASLGGSRGAGR